MVLVLRHSVEKHTYYCNFLTEQFCFNLMYSIVCQHGYDPLYMGFTVNLELLRDMTSVFSQSLVCWVFSSLLKPPHPLAMHFDLISGLFSLVKLSTLRDLQNKHRSYQGELSVLIISEVALSGNESINHNYLFRFNISVEKYLPLCCL